MGSLGAKSIQLAILLLGCALILSACAPGFSPTQKSELIKFEDIKGKVRYEHVGSGGELVDQTIIEDPLLDNYDRGTWFATSDSKVTTLHQPNANNRVHIVFVGDGYTRAELNQYALDVETNLAAMLAQEPFKSYRNYFAFHRVDVISEESGITEAVTGETKKTALEMKYNCAGLARLLCANLNKVMAQAQNAPKVHAVFALANSTRYGGAGYMSPAVSTFAARNSAALEVALHEFGHSFAGLGDEYDYGDESEACPLSPNISNVGESAIKSKRVKWYKWLNLSNVGAFKGACHTSTYYRPTMNSKMRSLGKPYEEVNTEQFIFKIYEKVRPIEFATPPGELSGHRALSIVPMHPNSHALKVTWYINDKKNSSLNGRIYVDTTALKLRTGLNKIKVVVTDPTPLVRDEKMRSALMTETLEWTLRL